MNIKGVIWAGLYVQNLPAAVAFYQEKIGLRLVRQGEGWADFDAGGGAMFELLEGGRASSTPKGRDEQSLVIGFQVDDLDQALAALKSRQITLLAEPGQYKNQRWAYFCDPEGNILELKEIRRP
jgi:predicted enzyme related to lactoylglutathione lyase